MKLLNGNTVGIDLGTTYSAIAQMNESGEPVCIENKDGMATTPSIVLFGDTSVIVGPTAERMAVEDPAHIVEAVKRQMGNKDFVKVYRNKRLTPEFISGLILKKLVQDAERQIGPIANAVITVPYYFNDNCRKATQDAGQIAGLNVIDIINEPTAATLAYAWLRGELGRPDLNAREKRIMVYDLGGGTFDVTLVRYTPTHFQVVATDGDVRLGGIDWTRRIVDYVAEQFIAKYRADPRNDPLGLMELTRECEAAKRLLSSRAQVPVTVRFGTRSLTAALTRGTFENITADLLQRTRDTTELVLQYEEIDPTSLDDVLLVGGSTYMPMVEEMLRDVCGRTPSRELNPDAAVAQGAAVHAAILEARATGGEGRMAQAVTKRLRAVTTSDVNSHSLGVEVTDLDDPTRKQNHIMIPRNTPLPHKVVEQFVTNVPNPRSIHLRLLQGEAADVDACTPIGDFRIMGLPPQLPVGSPVEVTYSYDANGRIHVAGRELVGMSKSTTEIVRDTGLTDAGLDAFKLLAREYQVD